MENSLLEILTYYVIGGALLIGAPGIFFLIVFMPALQNTKGDPDRYFLQISGNNP